MTRTKNSTQKSAPSKAPTKAVDPLKRIAELPKNATPEQAALLLDDESFLSAICKSNGARVGARKKLQALGVTAADFNKALATYEKAAKAKTKACTDTESPYQVVDRCFVRKAKDEHTPLCNFTASIVEDRVVDDGAEGGEQRREYLIEAKLATGDDLDPITVPAATFHNPADWLHLLGPKAIVYERCEHSLRVAIQKFSTDIKTALVMEHTGWRKMGGRHVYITAGGAIGVDVDATADATVRLEGRLANYSLPTESPDPTARRQAVQLSLRILDVAPDRVTFPLVAAVYRAPLMHWIRADVAVWLCGETQTRKSSLATECLRHWGSGFTAKCLSASFQDTKAKLESILYKAKDTLVVIDDMVPKHADDHDEQRRKAHEIVRSVGNGAGRGRMTSDMREQADRPPRGLAMMTAEDKLTGVSTLSRMFHIAVRKGDVRDAVLSEVQANSVQLPAAMRGYVEYIAGRADADKDFGAKLQRQFEESRAKFTSDVTGAHRRAPAAAADLEIGWRMFLEFAESVGAIDKAKAAELKQRFEAAVGEQLEAQAEAVANEDPVRRWLSCLGSLIAAGRVELLRQGNPAQYNEVKAPVIGWRCANGCIQLLPDPAWGEVLKALRTGGSDMPVTQNAFWDVLKERKLTNCQDGRNKRRKTVDGQTSYVIELAPGALQYGEDEVNEPAEDAVQTSPALSTPSTPKGPVDRAQVREPKEKTGKIVQFVQSGRRRGRLS